MAFPRVSGVVQKDENTRPCLGGLFVIELSCLNPNTRNHQLSGASALVPSRVIVATKVVVAGLLSTGSQPAVAGVLDGMLAAALLEALSACAADVVAALIRIMMVALLSR